MAVEIVTTREVVKWSKAVVSPVDRGMRWGSIMKSFVRLGRHSVRRNSKSWYCSGGNRFLSILANRLA